MDGRRDIRQGRLKHIHGRKRERLAFWVLESFLHTTQIHSLLGFLEGIFYCLISFEDLKLMLYIYVSYNHKTTS